MAGDFNWPKIRRQLQPLVKENLPGRPKKMKRKLSPEEIAERDRNRKREKAKEKKKDMNVPGKGAEQGRLGRTGIVMNCSLCGGTGHNKRGCKQNPKNQNLPERVEVPPPPIRATSSSGSKKKKSTTNTQSEVTLGRRRTRSSVAVGENIIESQRSVTQPPFKLPCRRKNASNTSSSKFKAPGPSKKKK